jgi:hypothetical protein
VLDCFFLATVEPDQIRINAVQASDLRWFGLAQPPAAGLRDNGRRRSGRGQISDQLIGLDFSSLGKLIARHSKDVCD